MNISDALVAILVAIMLIIAAKAGWYEVPWTSGKIAPAVLYLN